MNQAVAGAKWWAARPQSTLEQQAVLAGLFGEAGRLRTARKLFPQTAGKGLNSSRIYDLELQRATVFSGMQRWRILLRAAERLQPGSLKRANGLKTILSELREPPQAQAAAQLAKATDDREFQTALRIRQAELSTDSQAAADICWSLYRSRRLPDSRFAWACNTIHRGEQHKRTISMLEARLRSGKQLSEQLLIVLAEAYKAAGRDADALRAQTENLEIGRRGLTR